MDEKPTGRERPREVQRGVVTDVVVPVVVGIGGPLVAIKYQDHLNAKKDQQKKAEK